MIDNVHRLLLCVTLIIATFMDSVSPQNSYFSVNKLRICFKSLSCVVEHSI